MKRIVFAAALVAACADPTRTGLQGAAAASLAALPEDDIGRIVAARYPEVARSGAGEQAVWLVLDDDNRVLSWGRGLPSPATATTDLIDIRIGSRPRRPRQAGDPEPVAPEGLPMRRRSTEPQRDVWAEWRAEGRVLAPPAEWSGRRDGYVEDGMSDVRLLRYPAGDGVVTVVVLRRSSI